MPLAKKTNIAIIGYSGHAYVVIDTFHSMGRRVVAYCDIEKKNVNPYNLLYLGKEKDSLDSLKCYNWFVAIGDNKIRKKVYLKLTNKGLTSASVAIHKNVCISPMAEIKAGTMVGPNVTINAFAKIGTGVICNTGCIIEHECQINDFVHVAPGAVVAGNVKVGERTFLGANSVIKQGITIGENTIIGAGAVIINDIPDNVTVVGNPGRIIVNDR